MDLTALTDDDLHALKAGDLTKLSDAGLQQLKAGSPAAAPTPAAPAAPSRTDQILGALKNYFAPGADQFVADVKSSPLVQAGAGALHGAAGIGATLQHYLNPMEWGNSQADADRRAGINAGVQTLGGNPGSLPFKLGDAGAQIAGTAGVGGAVAAPIKALAAAAPALAPYIAPVAEAIASGGFRTGQAAAPGVGPAAADLALRSAGGAVNGAASAALTDPSQAGTGAVIGGAFPGATKIAGAVGSQLGGAARGAGAAAEPLYQGGREAIAGRALNSAAGAEAPAVAQRLAAAQPIIRGSAPTAAQVAENGGISALERAATQSNPADFAQRGMEQASARLQALRGIAGDDGTMAAAIEARKTATDPLYVQAKAANYTVDPRLESLLKTPAVQTALGKAQELAANNQRAFSFDVVPANPYSGVGVPTNTTRQVTGQGLQDLKMAMDQMLSDPTSGFAGKAGDAVRGLRGKLLNWMEDANPAFKQARTTFADMSRPVNQQQVGQALLQKVQPALADYGQLGSETANQYALGLRNADQTARVATKFKGAGMSDVMDPSQMDTINGVAADLARKANAQNLGRGVGSDTFQKLAMDNIASQSGNPRLTAALLSLPGVSKFTKFAYKGPDDQIRSLLSQALLDPATAAQLMTSAANPQQSAIRRLFANPDVQGLGYRAAAGGARRVDGP